MSDGELARRATHTSSTVSHTLNSARNHHTNSTQHSQSSTKLEQHDTNALTHKHQHAYKPIISGRKEDEGDEIERGSRVICMCAPEGFYTVARLGYKAIEY